MLLTDLATAVRKSGLPVVEVPGWQTRGHGEMGGVRTIVCHHTAGPSTGNFPSLGVVRDGRAGLSGPLANLGLGRDGTVYVIAAGLCYHAGVVLQSDYGNGYSIGIEAEATGVTDWPAVQMDAYARLCAALCLHYTLPVGRVLGHKEVCAPVGRKTDPNFDMAAFRVAVASVEEDDDMARSPKDWDDDDWAAVDEHVFGREIGDDGTRFEQVVNKLKTWLSRHK
jgi:hypothetical protein